MNLSRRQLSIASALLVFLAASTLGCFDYLTNRGRVSPDFKSFYAATRAASEGLDIYDAGDLRAVARDADVPGRVFPYLYPPFFAYVARPLASLTVQHAQWLWSLASVLAMALVALLSLLAATPPSREEPGGGRLLQLTLLGLLLLFLLPLRNNVMIGQMNILVLLFIALAVYAYTRKLDLLAGASLGVAVLIKLSPAILMFLFLAQRRVSTLVGLVISLLVGVGISLVLGAASAWSGFLAFVSERASVDVIPALGQVAVIWNFSLKAFFLRLLSGDPAVATTLATASALAILGVLIFASVKTREIAGSAEVLLLGFLALMVMASPLAYVHHVIFLYPGAVLLWGRLSRSEATGRVRLAFLLGLCSLVALASFDFPSHYKAAGVPLALCAINLFVLIALLVLSLLAERLLRHLEVPDAASPSQRST